MADPKSSKHPLELLPAYLNLVLIQTGKLLRDSDYRGPKAIGLAKSKVNEYVSAANGSFHDALDEIEVKILDAKSVMERDLSAIRKKRALREGVKIPLPAPSPVEMPAETSNEAMQIDELQIDIGGDLQMLDANMMTSQLPDDADAIQSQEQPQLSGEEMMIVDQAMPQDTDNTAGLAITLPGASSSNEKGESKTSDEANQNTAAKMEDIMGTTDGQEQQAETSGLDFDFESMFNDADFNTTDGAMNFNLDFSSTDQPANQGQSTLADNAFGNVATTGADVGNAAPTSDEDITGLLDDVFNQAGDAANAANNPVPAAPEPAKEDEATSQPPAQPAASAAAHSQFDDLFGTDTFDLGGDGDVLGDGNLAEFDFDEEWLKM